MALEEEERYIIEKASEDARKREELEEKLASEVVGGGPDEDNAPESTFDECHCHDNVKSQDHEERPDTPDADNETQVLFYEKLIFNLFIESMIFLFFFFLLTSHISLG